MSTTFGDDENSGGSSAILGSLFSSAASVTNTAIIANANPVNAAIITGTPLSTPGATVGAGAQMTSGSLFLVGALVVGLVLYMASQR